LPAGARDAGHGSVRLQVTGSPPTTSGAVPPARRRSCPWATRRRPRRAGATCACGKCSSTTRAFEDAMRARTRPAMGARRANRGCHARAASRWSGTDTRAPGRSGPAALESASTIAVDRKLARVAGAFAIHGEGERADRLGADDAVQPLRQYEP
jgi:hypothetical protein